MSRVAVLVVGEPAPAERTRLAVLGPDVEVVVLGAGGDHDLPPGTPFGAAVTAALSAVPAGLLLVVPATALPHLRLDPGPLGSAVRAFDEDLSLDLLTPHVHDGDAVVEAGSRLEAGGSLVPMTLPRVPGSPDDPEPARLTDGTTTGVALVRRSALVAAGGIDVEAGAVQAVADLVAAAGARGRSARAHPGLRVGAAAVQQEQVDTSRLVARHGWAPRVPAFRAVLVHDRVPVPGAPADDRVEALLEAMATLWPTAEVTLVAPEGRPRDGAHLRDRGIAVAAGPHDWPRWFAARPDPLDLVLITGASLELRLDEALRDGQPRAARVLVTAGLQHREALSMERAIDHAEEVAGVRTLTAALRERLAATLERVDAAWCTSAVDAGALRGLRDSLDVRVVPAGVAVSPGRPLGERSGVVVDATRGHDPRQASDEAAVLAVEELLPSLRLADPDLELTLLSESPSPLLDRLSRRPGVRLVRSGFAEVVAGARLVLVPHPYGLGGASSVTRAIAAGTPFVATAAAVRDHDLGGSQGLFVAPDLLGVAALGRVVLTQDTAWHAQHRAVLGLAPAAGRTAMRAALVAALAPWGIAPPREERWHAAAAPPPVAPERDTPDAMVAIPADLGQVRTRAQPEPALASVTVRQGRIGDLDRARAYYRDGGVREVLRMGRQRLRRVAPVVVGGQKGLPDYDTQYGLWVQASGPGTDRVAEVDARAAALTEPPTFTVVIPTYESPLDVLAETVASITGQSYPHWQLVLSDDASPSDAVRDGLVGLAATDPRIVLVLNEANSGISGATNAGVAAATGEFLAFCDHDDLLKPHALAAMAVAIADGRASGREPDVLYSDEDKADEHGRLVSPFFKPDWSPNQLLSRNYLNHLTVLRRTLVEQVGGLRSEYDGSQDHDLLLRVTERTSRVVHVPDVLYTWRMVAGSTADVVDAKPYAFDAARRALTDTLARRGIAGRVEDGLHLSTYRVRYDIVGRPRVAVIIPTRDRVELLRQCIESVRGSSTYRNVEFVVVDNESTDPETLEYLARFHQTVGGRVVRYPHRFNYARMMTLGGLVADADQLLFLNNDTTVIAPDWIEALVEHAQRPEVGAVGGRLRYPHGAIQHEGVIVNYSGGAAGNVNHSGWWAMGDVVRDVTAVTGAVTMMRPSVFAEIGGFDDRLRVAFNDVDLCLRVRQAGYQVVYTPYAELYHHESASRGVRPHLDDDAFFEDRWGPSEYRDPYYSPHLDRSRPFLIYTRGGAPEGGRTDATGEVGLGLVAGAVTPTVH